MFFEAQCVNKAINSIKRETIRLECLRFRRLSSLMRAIFRFPFLAFSIIMNLVGVRIVLPLYGIKQPCDEQFEKVAFLATMRFEASCRQIIRSEIEL